MQNVTNKKRMEKSEKLQSISEVNKRAEYRKYLREIEAKQREEE